MAICELATYVGCISHFVFHVSYLFGKGVYWLEVHVFNNVAICCVVGGYCR